MEMPCWRPSEGHQHGGRKVTETSVIEGLFTGREGYPSKRVTLAFADVLFFFFVVFRRQLGLPRKAGTLSAC